MRIVDTFHDGCNVDAPKGSALLLVLTTGEMDDYAAYYGLVTLPHANGGKEYEDARDKASWRVAGGGKKMRFHEAKLQWDWLKEEEYRA